MYSGHFGWYFGDFQALRCIGGQWGAAGCSREQELLIRKLKILLRCSFFLWAASLCRFACSSRIQRLRGKNLHRKISKKSTIDLLEVKLQYEMQNIFWATKFSENFRIDVFKIVFLYEKNENFCSGFFLYRTENFQRLKKSYLENCAKLLNIRKNNKCKKKVFPYFGWFLMTFTYINPLLPSRYLEN